MRDLLGKLDLISEERTLNPGTINKYASRFEKFLQMIQTGMPFYTVDKEPVIADPKEAKRFATLNKQGLFKGALKLKLDDGSEISLNKLLKTADLGGQASTGQEGEETGKEAALLKPTQIGITDKDIPADKLGDEIINNSVLKSTDYGRIVIQMAKTILAGGVATIPKDTPEKIRKSIVDYAGEYLGVLALVTGNSRFPRRKGFEEWLGGSVDSLTINFPSKSNLNIADSFASISNKKTQHTVNISSKGTGGGAPPSLSGLKIPERLKKNKDFVPAIEFIEICNLDKPSRQGFGSPRTVSQIFEAMNLLHKYNPDSLPKKFNKFLPWDSNITNLVVDSMNEFKRTGKGDLPKYQKLWQDINFRSQSSDGGKLVFAVKDAVMRAVNEGNALPEFSAVVLEVLGDNFIQNYADYDGRTKSLTFSTQWPAKLDGKISLKSKSGSTDPTKGGLSFKLGKKEEPTDLEQPDESGPDAGNTVGSSMPLNKAADLLTKGVSKPISMKPKSNKGIGRAKRK